MLTLKDIRKAAKQHGATIEVSAERCAISDEKVKRIAIDSPAGMVWSGNDCHLICGSFYTSDKSDQHNCAQDLIGMMSYGLEPCVDPDCDHCNPGSDDE